MDLLTDYAYNRESADSNKAYVQVRIPYFVTIPNRVSTLFLLLIKMVILCVSVGIHYPIVVVVVAQVLLGVGVQGEKTRDLLSYVHVQRE